MRVNLMIDDNLLQQAMPVSGVTTTQEVMERALRLLIGQSIPTSYTANSPKQRK